MDHEPVGSDLIVFSELGYYFERDVLAELIDRLLGALLPGGEFLACHWLGSSADHRLHGDDVHHIIGGRPGIEPTIVQRHEDFRIESWARTIGGP